MAQALEHPSISIYIHSPFCSRHCSYCDFNTYVARRHNPLVRRTVEAICRDIHQTAVRLPGAAGRNCATVFFGGGTPTLLPAGSLLSILSAIRSAFPLAPGAEISCEANPDSSDAAQFERLCQGGINRLSIGAQSFDDGLLHRLDRTHTGQAAAQAYELARQAGFRNISLDLMFRLPAQSSTLWRRTIAAALSLGPEHLSLYGLTIEPGTRFERQARGGRLELPSEEAELEMYCFGREALAGAGYQQYEVSNFAREGFRCRHNLVYWRNEEYLGFGPGAVSYCGGVRWKRERLPARYVAAVDAGLDLTVEAEALSPEASLGESMMLGLRLREGVDLAAIRNRYGLDPLKRYATEIERLCSAGLLIQAGDHLRLTDAGLFLADSVAMEFLAA
ncbi:MAG TPA: radical SAM family heme chaperone HemW [Chthonomonadales bacterium]|nr:radical SAM family heme chaperone HemW [Chthonomonadales bacterium]